MTTLATYGAPAYPDSINPHKSLGASRAAGVLGMSPFSCPLREYLHFTGALPSWEGNEQTEIGIEVEPAIIRLMERRLGQSIPRPVPRTHPSIQWMHASPDGMLDSRRGVEVKNVSVYMAKDWGEPGTDKVPPYYLVQCQQQAAVFGFDVVHVGALIGGSELKLYEVPRSDELIERIIEIEADFMRRVEARDPPPIDWTDPRTPELVALLNRPEPGRRIELFADAQQFAEEYERLGAEKRDAKAAQELLKAKLIDLMGSASEGELPDGRLVTRKLVVRKAHPVAESRFFDLHIKKGKR